MSTVQRCDPDDVNRCQATIKNGTSQCCNLATPDFKSCSLHGGIISKKEQAKNYAFARWSREISEKANSPVLKNLHEEIGLLRFLLEQTINKCETENDLMLSSGPISDMVLKIEKLVVSCNVLDTKLGNSLDKNQLLKFATIIIDIVATNVTDPEITDAIASGIIEALGDETTFEVE